MAKGSKSSRTASSIFRVLFDIAIVVSAGIFIASVVGILQTRTAFGDDALVHVLKIRNLAEDPGRLIWDPSSFNGYSSIPGFGWLDYGIPAILVLVGMNPVSAYNLQLIFTYLLYGCALYFFSRVVNANRVVSLAIPILAWSASSYWNITVWGAATDRVFSLPFAVIALSVTYRFVELLNLGHTSGKWYVLVITFWTVTMLGNLYVAAYSVSLGAAFVLFSAGLKQILNGFKRLIQVFLPVFGLSSWNLLPIIIKILTQPSLRQDVNPNPWGWLFSQTITTWEGVIQPIFILSILSFSLCLLVSRWTLKKRPGIEQSPKQLGTNVLIIILCASSIYWLLMGWVPVVWRYLPRVMATYNSVDTLTWNFLFLLAGLSSLIEVRFREYKKLRFQLAFFFLLFVILNSFFSVPAVKPVNWNDLNQTLATYVPRSLTYAFGDHRISLAGRELTRSLPYFYPYMQQTGGRQESLDPNPFYQGWYQSEVFWQRNLSQLGNVYVEDQPPVNVPDSLLSLSSNLAETQYWLDWYGVRQVVLLPSYYPVSSSVEAYAQRPLLFSVSNQKTTFGLISTVTYLRSTPILLATNASVIGFFSTNINSLDGYHGLLALLSRLGLGPKYVVTVYLRSIQVRNVQDFDLIMTDADTFISNIHTFCTILAQHGKVLVLPSDSTEGKIAAVDESCGGSVTGSVTVSKYSISQLLSKATGSLYLLNLINTTIPYSMSRPTLGSFEPEGSVSIQPANWQIGFKTAGIRGVLNSSTSILSINLKSYNDTIVQQLNIDSALSNPIPLFNQTTVNFQIWASYNVTLGVVFSSQLGCCPAYYASYNIPIRKGSWITLSVPFSSFNWNDPKASFAEAKQITLAFNVPPGASNATFLVKNFSVVIPSYVKFTLTTPAHLSDDGIMVYFPLHGGTHEVLLSNFNNTRIGTAEFTGESHNASVLTFASFVTGNNSDSFTDIFVTGGTASDNMFIIVPKLADWTIIHGLWKDTTDFEIFVVPVGYKGILWKETFTENWLVRGTTETNSSLTLDYFYSGPGLVYIPLRKSGMANVHISYLGLNELNVMVYSISAVVSLAWIGYTTGRSRRHRSSDKLPIHGTTK